MLRWVAPTHNQEGPSDHTETGKRNQRGQTLVDTCNQENWVFTHSWTPQNNKNTWKHPRFKTEHQLDHFITEHRYIRNVNRVLTIHPESIRDPQAGGWEEYTDHKPVEMTVRLAPPAFYKPSHTPARRIAVQRGRGCSDQAVALRNKIPPSSRGQTTRTPGTTGLANHMRHHHHSSRRHIRICGTITTQAMVRRA